MKGMPWSKYKSSTMTYPAACTGFARWLLTVQGLKISLQDSHIQGLSVNCRSEVAPGDEQRHIQK